MGCDRIERLRANEPGYSRLDQPWSFTPRNSKTAYLSVTRVAAVSVYVYRVRLPGILRGDELRIGFLGHFVCFEATITGETCPARPILIGIVPSVIAGMATGLARRVFHLPFPYLMPPIGVAVNRGVFLARG